MNDFTIFTRSNVFQQSSHVKSLNRHHHVRPTISTEKSRTRFVENMFERTPIRHHVAHPQLQTGFCCPNKSFWEISLCGGDSDLAGSRVNPHVPRLRCGQAAESALSTRKSPAGQNSSKNVTLALEACVGCRLDAIAYIKMKRIAQSRVSESFAGEGGRAALLSQLAKPASP